MTVKKSVLSCSVPGEGSGARSTMKTRTRRIICQGQAWRHHCGVLEASKGDSSNTRTTRTFRPTRRCASRRCRRAESRVNSRRCFAKCWGLSLLIPCETAASFPDTLSHYWKPIGCTPGPRNGQHYSADSEVRQPGSTLFMQRRDYSTERQLTPLPS